MIWNSGRFILHLLHRGQFDLVHRLGFVSGRDGDKLATIEHHPGKSGVPILNDCYAAFECQVINTMDTGYATHYLGDVVAMHRGQGEEILTPAWFRANLPPQWNEEFLHNYREAQKYIEQNPGIQDRRWTGPAST
jgi:flavin reductase (DIM6/NTAB) family NADH-FMN oxidoreductase RutF